MSIERVDESLEEMGAEPTPQPPPRGPTQFTRLLEMPPGFPWEQAQAARLEARNASPVAGEVSIEVRREGGWRPGQPGRFRATYARAGDLAGLATAPTEQAPSPLALRDAETGAWTPFARGLGVVVLALAPLLMAATGAGWSAARREAALGGAESMVQQKFVELGRAAGTARTSRLVESENLGGRTLDAFLADLAWASRSKAPEAEIRRVLWNGDILLVDAAGAASPFAHADRVVAREAQGSAAGISRWRVERPADAGQRGRGQ